MKKKIFARVLSVAMAMLVAFGLVMIPEPTKTLASGASQSVKYSDSMSIITEATEVKMGSKLKNAKSVSIKSSKKSVVEPYKWYKEFGTAIIVTGKKAGKADLTIKVKYKNGTSKTYTSTVKVSKYTNPFKSLKIGDKNIASKFKKGAYANVKSLKSGKQKVSVKLKKNWKLKSIKYKRYNFDDTSTEKTIKNNKSVKLIANEDKATESMTITVYNKSTKATVDIFFYIG